MKRIFVVGLLCIVYTFSCQAQGLYSEQNLQNASQESLRIYLAHAKTLKKTGAVLSIAGSATAVAGFVVFAIAYDDDEFLGYNTGTTIGGWMTVIGTSSTLVGLPILITGSSRVKKVNNAINSDSGKVFIRLSPCTFPNYMARCNQAGLALRMRF